MTTSQKGPRDVFLHLLMILTLYFSVGSFLSLAFQMINVTFPDPLEYYANPGSSIRWSLASLIVVFPVFLWVSRLIQKDQAVNPEKMDLRIRKWLLYLTLFLAAGLIIGDLVTLIFNFLEGDLTARFILKVLVILAVAIAVFGYYLYDLRRAPVDQTPREKIFIYAVIATVAVSIVSGFWLAGSPFKQQSLRFDERRIEHLQNIQGRIVNYWLQKSRLPVAIDDLVDNISGFQPPLDPKTNQPYQYEVTGDLSFRICAEFNLDSSERQISISKPFAYDPRGELDGNWDHPVGKFCFDRTIDPEFYRPEPIKK